MILTGSGCIPKPPTMTDTCQYCFSTDLDVQGGVLVCTTCGQQQQVRQPSGLVPRPQPQPAKPFTHRVLLRMQTMQKRSFSAVLGTLAVVRAINMPCKHHTGRSRSPRAPVPINYDPSKPVSLRSIYHLWTTLATCVPRSHSTSSPCSTCCAARRTPSRLCLALTLHHQAWGRWAPLCAAQPATYGPCSCFGSVPWSRT